MTAIDDFDRRFGQFLEDGPTRAPERPADLAIAHALAHPRRRDPFAVLRRDPMAPVARWSAQPVLAFAVLGLLLVVSAAAFLVGGQRQQPVVVPPTSAAIDPTPAPSVAPTATPVSTPRRFSAEITDANGLAKTIVVVDESGLLENVFGGEVTDPDRPQNAEIEAVQLGADEGGGMDGIVLHWVDLSCEDDYLLTVGPDARELVLEGASCGADAFPVAHEVWLDFSEPVPAAEVEERIERP